MNLKQKLSEMAVKVALITGKVDEWEKLLNSSTTPAHLLIDAADGMVEAMRFAYGWDKGNPPELFWKTAEGKLIASAYYRAYGDDNLITLNRAAQITHGLTEDESSKNGSHRVFITNNLNILRGDGRPKLRLFMHPTASFPKRVLLSEVRELAKEYQAGKRKRAKRAKAK
jgi:hypothetical protein